MNNIFLEKELSNKNVRPTAVRLRVLDLFKKNPVAVSLNEIEDELKPVDRITLFRTLKTFEKHGIIHTVSAESGHVKYAPCAESCSCSYADHMHVHFSCQSCHKMYCLYDLRIPIIELPAGFKPVDASVVIKGTCKHC